MGVLLRIKVTKEILRKTMWCGTVDMPGTINENCAVAMAVRDIFPRALVWGNIVAPFGEPYVDSIKLPEKVTKFIDTFDTTIHKNRHDLPELEFDLEIPNEIIAKINIDEIKPLLVNHPTLKLISLS